MRTQARSLAAATTSSGVGSLLREPALPLLLAASVAMVVRRYPPDIALFTGACVLLVVDARRWDRARERSAQPPAAGVAVPLLVVALLPVACLAALLPAGSGRLDAFFAAVGLVALWCCWAPGGDRPTQRGTRAGAEVAPARPPRWAAWPALTLAVLLVELWSFAHQTSPRVDSPAHPTLSTVTEPALAWSAVRAVALWWWLAAGVWLLRRVRAWTS